MTARREAGFTLLEVLIAFIIAALAIGVMVDGVVGGLRSAATAAQVEQAVALARSRMAAAEATVLSGPPPQPTQSGNDGGFRWKVDLSAAKAASMPRDESVPIGISSQTPTATLYAIKVVVQWTVSGAVRQVRLDGAQLRLTSPAAAS